MSQTTFPNSGLGRVLRQKSERLISQAEAILNKCTTESREPSAAEDTEFKWLLGQVDDIQKRVAQMNAMEQEIEARTMPATNSSSAPELHFNQTGTGPYVPTADVRVVEPRLKAFRNSRDAHDCGLWLKSMLLCHTPRHGEGEAARNALISRRGEAWLASQNESTGADGGYLVPPSFDSAVQTYREQVGALRKLARVVQMGSDTWTGFKQTSGTSVYYPGEEGSITESDANFARYTLTAKKRAILTYVSNELNNDSLVSIMDLLAQDMGHQFALKEDQDGIVGDGTSSYGGVLGIRPAILSATASIYTPTSDEDAWSEVTIGTLLAGMSLVADKYRGPNMKWLISAPAKWQIFDRLALAQGGTVAADMTSGVPQFSFLGYPVVVSDRMPTTEAVSQVFAIFGSFADAVVLGERGGIRVDVSPHYSFDKDRLAVRATNRIDIHVHEEGDTSTAGAIVGVATHS